ncbi:DUF2243 domain-containing protein [Virgibacillus flavescens]|uniref:DUF2243 domain-containing protein n=1 Tax=Virgibacillus flavescens TaxID=1611422 RepID=UPI003D34B59B
MTNKVTNRPRSLHLSRNLWSGFLVGLGLVAFLDEMIFHQLLHWHHFYDKSTLAAGLVSDGFFHAFSWFATIGGMFLVADLRRRKVFWFKRWCGGVMFGGGLFQLYDGIIQHKVMRLHQIRYDVNLQAYDLVWNASALILIIAGVILLILTRHKSSKDSGAT